MNYLDVFRSGVGNTEILQGALDAHNRLVNSDKAVMIQLEQELRARPDTQKAANMLLKHIESGD